MDIECNKINHYQVMLLLHCLLLLWQLFAIDICTWIIDDPDIECAGENEKNRILFTWNNDQLVFHKTQPTRVHKFERLFLFKSEAPAG